MAKATRKIPVRGVLWVNAFAVLARAVEEGVAYGWNRAHKHTPTPPPEAVQQAIEDAVMSEVSVWFSFDDPD